MEYRNDKKTAPSKKVKFLKIVELLYTLWASVTVYPTRLQDSST